MSRRNTDRAAIHDLINSSTTWHAVGSTTSPIAAFLSAVRLLYEQNVELFFGIDPQNVYRRDYITNAVARITNSRISIADSAFCFNLIHQEWAAWQTEGAGNIFPYHFNGGLGLAPEEQSAGQQVGAPGTFIFTRPAAERLLTLCGNLDEYADVAYDIVLRRYLLHKGINIQLLKTESPVFVHMSSHPAHDTHSAQPAAAPTMPPRASCRAAGGRRPTVSVVIPTYNEGEWLYRTVDSISQAASSQPWEVVVVDDGCDDGSVDRIRDASGVRIVRTPAPQSGIIVAKNLGAEAASGRFLCFLDSHILVNDWWLDRLLTTCESATREAIVTGNIFDVRQRNNPDAELGHQYGYTLSSWTLDVRWHHYGTNLSQVPYSVPLCPGGMMFLHRSRFKQLGGFASALRKWGGEDIELSLRHYCAGGQILCDPTTHCFHFYKDTKNNKRKFSVTYKQTSFNALYTARIYMDHYDYYNVRKALCSRARLDDVVADVESAQYDHSVARAKMLFERSFDDWKAEFYRELAQMMSAKVAISATTSP